VSGHALLAYVPGLLQVKFFVHVFKVLPVCSMASIRESPFLFPVLPSVLPPALALAQTASDRTNAANARVMSVRFMLKIPFVKKLFFGVREYMLLDSVMPVA